MSGRGLTPQGKETSKNPQSTSKFRTPPNLNSTYLERRDTSSKFSKNRPISRYTRTGSCSHLDVTGIIGSAHGPAVKANLTNLYAPLVDHELECDLAYIDDLQALQKEEILKKAVKKHEEEINDQLALQRDNLYKTKLKCKEAKEELADLEQLEEVTKLIETLSNNFVQFQKLSESFDLKSTLEQLLSVLNQACSKVSIKNVKPLETHEDCSKLELVLKECLTVLEMINLCDRNQKQVNNLAEVMSKYQEQVHQVNEKQKFITTTQENEVFKLLKSLSQMYAKREHYQSAST